MGPTDCIQRFCRFLSLSIISYSAFISTLFCFVLKSNPPAQGAEDELKKAMYIFLGLMYALDIGKKIIIIKAKELKTRFTYDIVSNGLKIIVQLFVGMSIMMTEHNINVVIYALGFFILIGLIILRMVYVCCFSWRLRRKLKQEDYDDEEFVAYRLSLSNTAEIKEWMKNNNIKASLIHSEQN